MPCILYGVADAESEGCYTQQWSTDFPNHDWKDVFI